MGAEVSYPEGLFDPGKRHLVVYAHFDDELPNGGLLSRLGDNVRVIWVTNSDGVAPQAGAHAVPYAEDRKQESINAVSHIGLDESQLGFLDYSELEIYATLARMTRQPAAPVSPLFTRIANDVLAEAEAFEPDVIWTQAWQGGHPEHDLTHLCAARAHRRLGLATPLMEFPAYEFVILVPLRFRPWRDEPYHAIQLSDDELEAKNKMFTAYPTQDGLLDAFKKLIGLYGTFSALRGKSFSFDDYARKEVFGQAAYAYDKSTHMHEFFDYMFDDYEGTPIVWSKTTPRIARALGLVD